MELKLQDLDLMEEWRSAFPCMDETNLRLVHRHLDQAALRLVLSTELEYLSDEVLEKYFTPPASPEETTIKVLADIVVALLFPEKIIKCFFADALAGVDEAYSVIKQDGGGWSSDENKSNPEKRKTTMLAWYKHNQPRLFYLRETYLQDLSLYFEGGGQERRNFRNRLLTKIIEHTTKQKLTVVNVKSLLDNFKKPK